MTSLKLAFGGLIIGALVCTAVWAQSSSLGMESDTDSQPQRSFQAQVRTLFDQENFRQLDQIAEAALSQKQRFLGGGWKLKIFYNALRGPGPLTATDKEWNAHIKRLEHWTAVSPSSIAPRLALAGSYIRFAWKARGNERGDTVTSEGWRIFAERITKALDTLNDAKSMDASDPEWYCDMETVGLAQGWSREAMHELVQDAGNSEQGYFYTYDQYVNYMLPKWYGQPGEAEDVLKSVADQIGGTEGDSIYFQITMNLNCCRERPQMPNLSWDRVKQGFAATEKLYGTTNQQLNGLAFMAVRQGDSETARQVFSRIGGNWNEYVWGNKDQFDRSKTTLSLGQVSPQ